MATTIQNRNPSQTQPATAQEQRAKLDRAVAAADDAGEGPSPFEQARAEAARLSRRYRRQAAPLVVIGGTHVAGYTAAALTGLAVLIPLAVGAAAAACACRYARARVSHWNAVYARVAATAALTWVSLAALAGADEVMAAVLWLGGAAVALPYWVRHAEPDPDVTAERQQPTATPPPPDETADQRVVAWGRHLGGKGKPLAGSSLSEVADLAYGWRAVAHLPTGEHWTKIRDTRQAILSVYDLPDGRVCVEPLPGESVRRVRLTVLTEDPLRIVRHWRGPGLDPARGTFPLMTTADGDTLAFRLWWSGAGACHALVSGTTGSGKSATLDLILGELAYSDRYIPWIVDGGDGASNPAWVHSPAVGHVATNAPDARRLLTYALRVAKRRKRYLRQIRWRDEDGNEWRGRSSIDPTPAMPGIGIVIDEAHNLLMGDDNADIKRMVEILTQEGRKVAMSVILSTQVPSAVQLGGSTVIRNMLKSGTVVGLRTTETTAANMVGNGQPLPEPLHTLPAAFGDGEPTQGLGYVLTNRLIRARTLYQDYPQRWAMAAPAVTPLDEWSAAVEPPELAGDDDADLDGLLRGQWVNASSEPPQTRARVPETAVSSRDAAAVREALDAGTARELPALMATTGLPLGAVRRALTQLN